MSHADGAVSQMMSKKVFSVHPDDDLSTVWTVMTERGVRHVPVVDDEGELVGLVSHRDLLRASLVEQSDVPPVVEWFVLEHTCVGDVMTRDVETIEPGTAIAEAAMLLLEYRLGSLPVCEGRKLVGIVTEADFVRLAASAVAA